MKNGILIAGVFAVALILGPALSQSNYNAFEPPPMHVMAPTVRPTTSVMRLPRGVLFDATLAGVGQVDIHAKQQFTVTITETCPPSIDYMRTYFDGSGPRGEEIQYTLYGSHFFKQYVLPAGRWSFYIDNICPLTHVIMRY